MNYEYLKCPHRIGMVLNTRIVQQVLYQEVADRLRAMIQARELEAGEWIDEVALTKTLGISRTPLREALKVLVAEEIGRAACRERGCKDVEIRVVDVTLKKK